MATSMRVTVASVAGAWLCAGCNDAGLYVGPADLRVEPAAIDFGRVRVGSESASVLTVRNVGGSPLRIDGVDGLDTGDAFHVDGPVDAAAVVLDPGETLALEVRFLPPTPGPRNAELAIRSDDPDEPAVAIPVAGTAFAVQVDEIAQGAQVPADILFVVDDSGSMGDEQSKLAASFDRFVRWLTGIDLRFHLGVVTTDMSAPQRRGRLVGSPAVLTDSTTDLVARFNQNARVGTAGSGQEQGMEAARQALSAPLLANENAGFLRAEADLFVVFVSDEEDQSPLPVADYAARLAETKEGDPDRVFVAAIVGPSPAGCHDASGNADAGTRYLDLAARTGGLAGSICEPEFATTLESLAFEIAAPRAEFPLSRVPDAETIAVWVSGQPQAEYRWEYLADRNAIAFAEAHVPPYGARVRIEYETSE